MTAEEKKARAYHQRKKHLEKARDQARRAKWRKYGIFNFTAADYERKLVEQGGGCAICRQPPLSRRLNVDHDHRTKKIRGLLCYHCNRFLVSRHTLHTAELVVEYLKKWRSQTSS